MRGLRVLGLSVVLLSGLLSMAAADSLWKESDLKKGANASTWSNHKAYKEGDTVMVLIVESAQASQSASTKTQKDGSVSGGLGNSLSAPFTAGGGQWVGMGASERQNGAGNNARSGSLKATVSATITKILANGNMEIKGNRMVTVNDEKESIEVSGTIRPTDISPDNAVFSTAMADARIVYEGKGPLGEKASPGLLTRILDWLWIF